MGYNKILTNKGIDTKEPNFNTSEEMKQKREKRDFFLLSLLPSRKWMQMRGEGKRRNTRQMHRKKQKLHERQYKKNNNQNKQINKRRRKIKGMKNK